jgi:hypothetical protein
MGVGGRCPRGSLEAELDILNHIADGDWDLGTREDLRLKQTADGNEQQWYIERDENV